MSEQSMIERVTEAMRDEPFIDDERCLGTTQHDQRLAHYAAIAIKAMREPSFAMVKAMFNTKDDGAGSLHERKWKATIDAALVGEG